MLRNEAAVHAEDAPFFLGGGGGSGGEGREVYSVGHRFQSLHPQRTDPVQDAN